MFNNNQPPFLFGEGEAVSKKPVVSNKIRFLRGLGNWGELGVATCGSELFALIARLIPVIQPVYWIVSGGVVVVLVVQFVTSQGRRQSQLSRLIMGILIGAALGWVDAITQLTHFYWEIVLAVLVLVAALAIFTAGIMLAQYFKNRRQQQAGIFGRFDQ